MSISKGSLVTASDMSDVLTASNFFDTINLDALKEALNVANTGGAKIVGSGSASVGGTSSMTITLSTSDYDFLEIVSHAYGDSSRDADKSPVSVIVHKGQTSGVIPLAKLHYYSSSNTYTVYQGVENATFSLSGKTLTITDISASAATSSTDSYSCIVANVTCYKY